MKVIMWIENSIQSRKYNRLGDDTAQLIGKIRGFGLWKRDQTDLFQLFSRLFPSRWNHDNTKGLEAPTLGRSAHDPESQ